MLAAELRRSGRQGLGGAEGEVVAIPVPDIGQAQREGQAAG